MNSSKPKSNKPKEASTPIKDLRPAKDAKGGAQKKEILDPLPQGGGAS